MNAFYISLSTMKLSLAFGTVYYAPELISAVGARTFSIGITAFVDKKLKEESVDVDCMMR
jgi:hypothetical protein